MVNFNFLLSSVINDDNKLFSNKEIIKDLVNERLHNEFKLLDYYYNNSNWFKWNIELFNDDKKTIIIKFSYKLFYINNNSDENGRNHYNIEVAVNITSSDKYYANETWKRFLVGNTKINYDPDIEVTMIPAISLDSNNPWFALNQQPYPQNPGKIDYPDFGTWYINTNTTINYHSLPNENELINFVASWLRTIYNERTVDDEKTLIMFKRILKDFYYEKDFLNKNINDLTSTDYPTFSDLIEYMKN